MAFRPRVTDTKVPSDGLNCGSERFWLPGESGKLKLVLYDTDAALAVAPSAVNAAQKSSNRCILTCMKRPS